MIKAKQETIADIVADIRAQNQGLPEDDYALSPLVCDLLSFANRIEAAAKRADDQWRAALKPVLDISIDMNTSDLAMSMAIKKAKRIYNELQHA